MIATATLDGSRLLKACNYDHRLCASIVASQGNWEQLLDSITSPDLRRNVASIVWQIRESLGLEADYALKITQGTA
jgi:hypothetical protein